jgi:DNA-binding HxlR family transcriptional regulator
VGAYGDYCPIAASIDVIGDRWSPLVLRELMVGSTRFNEIHRGLPRMSRNLLVQRLRMLERNGLVERHPRPGSQMVDYQLTPVGKELEPVLWELGKWAVRWRFDDPVDEQLDTVYLVWRLHQQVDLQRVPERRTTVEFATKGPGGGRAWLVFDRGESTPCQLDPGYEPDVLVQGETKELFRWWIGRATWAEVCDGGEVKLVGDRRLVEAFPTWFLPSLFHAEVREAVTGT